MQQGYRCGSGVGFQVSDVNDLFPKTISLDRSKRGSHDDSEDWLVAVQARQSVAWLEDRRTTRTSKKKEAEEEEEEGEEEVRPATENTESKRTLDKTTMMTGGIGTWTTLNLILVMSGMRTMVEQPFQLLRCRSRDLGSEWQDGPCIAFHARS